MRCRRGGIRGAQKQKNMDKRVDGHTVWGKRWLSALVNSDLSRTVEYAIKMSQKWTVKDLELSENAIKARVSENPKKSYYLQFFMKRWTVDNVDALLEQIEKNPLLTANIQNGEISDKNSLTAIEKCLKKTGLSLFPTCKKDLKMYCSCPSWSMPCYHVAMVLYRLVDEIDKSPFVLFQLHGVDLREELRMRSGDSTMAERYDIEELEELLERRTENGERRTENGERKTENGERRTENGKRRTENGERRTEKGERRTENGERRTENGERRESERDRQGANGLSTENGERRTESGGEVADMGFVYSMVLPDSPGFCIKDNFRRVLEGQVKFISERVKKMLEEPDHIHEIVHIQRPRMEISNDCQFTVNQDIEAGAKWNIRLIVRLAQATEEEMETAGPYMKALRKAVMTSLELISKRAVVPHIGIRKSQAGMPADHQGGEFAIVWRPAMMDGGVRAVVEGLGLPPDLLTVSRTHQLIGNQEEIVVTLIINNIIKAVCSVSENDRLSNIFFKGLSIDEKEIRVAVQIKRWLEHITIGAHKYSPIIVIEDDAHGDEGGPVGDFYIHIAMEVDGQMLSLASILSEKAYDDIRGKAIIEVSMLSPYIDNLNKYIDNGAKTAMRYSGDELIEFLGKMMPLMERLGIRIMLPDTLRKLVRPSIRRTIDIQPGGVGHLSMAEMLSIEWKVDLGTESLTPQEFSKITLSKRGFARIHGRYIYLDENDIQRLKEALKGVGHFSSAELLQAALSENFKGEPVQLTDEVRNSIARLSEEPELAVPRGLKGKLRPYQKRGYEWMYRNSQLGFGSIIADDMGLGKTIQVIALLLKFKQETRRAKFLVIVPTSLVTNWVAEVKRFAPTMECMVYHGSGRDIDKFKKGILLTTYGVLRSDAEILAERDWHTVVIDEAQNIKNANTTQSKIVRKLNARNHIAMSGTPIENRMSEFWSIMDFTNHGYLGSAEKFRNVYSNPIEQFGNKECAERFRRVTAPFLLRRLKSDRSIINDLPDKIEENTYVTLTDEQERLYSRAVDEALAIIEKVGRESSQSLFKRQGLVLQMILTLKQICNHPALFTGKGRQDSSPTAAQSGKSERLIEMLDGIVANNQKTLIFTQFKEMGELLTMFISTSLGEEPLFLHGGCSVKERRAMVEEFQNDPKRHVFILSIKAGGTGLNLTAASHVIHYDLWWNPAVESQATDRAYRIGQHQNVIVHRFITKESFEEQIDRMIQEKKNLADMTVATGESWIAKLSNSELEEIFKN